MTLTSPAPAETVATRFATRRTRPVKVFAFAGASFVALQIYVYAAWIVSGDARRTPTGPDPVPWRMELATRAWETTMVVCLIGVLWFVVIRPWRRAGSPTFDGVFVLALLAIYWQDPLVDYSQMWFTYNAAFVNLGSWTTHVPGWLAPNGNLLPEPIVGILPLYGTVVFAACVLTNLVMRRAKARWPRLGTFGLIAVAVGFCALFDLFLEPSLLLPLGLLAYPGAAKGWTLFHGHYYQYPVYEAAYAGIWFAGLACARYFRNDRGQTVAERGLDELRVSRRQSALVRFLALAGILNCWVLVVNVLLQVGALNAGAWPGDYRHRSYLTNGFCGAGTTYACPGPDVPIAHRGSARLGPSGEVVPAGTPRAATPGAGSGR